MTLRWWHRLGLGALAAGFVFAAVRLAWRSHREDAPGGVVIRIAHWQLESGLREAEEALAQRYMAAHPGVTIELIPVPYRVYGTWLRTQLVGGTAPDLVEFGQMQTDVQDELLARYFTPLTAELERPNPYNAGTALAATPWRETFVDGLDGSYRNSNLKEYFLIPTAMTTERIYYNRTLWHEVLGDTAEPRTFAELQQIGTRVRAFARRTGRLVVPVAGSQGSLGALDREFASQTQRLGLDLDLDHNLVAVNTEIAAGWLRGRWHSDGPEFRRGFELARDLADLMTPGFVNLGRDDATFLFLQDRALMVYAGSWDYTSLVHQAGFPIGVFPLPLPALDDPRFGTGRLGPFNELDRGAQCNFALNASSPHRAVALDFLRFVSSLEGNRLFMERSHWLPAVVGITPPDYLRPFEPASAGYPKGFDAHFVDNLGYEVRRLWETHVDRLTAPTDGVATMERLYDEEFGPALRTDLGRLGGRYRENVARQDSMIAALTGLAEADPAARDRAREKRSEILQQQTFREAEAAWSAQLLRDHAAR